jgi:TolB-like protein
LLTLVGVGLYFLAWRGRVIDSLAVLPLANGAADPNAEYLCDGITESLINSLSQLPQLRVTARTTAFRYKDQVVDPRQVGSQLGVRAVLTGRLTQRGDALIIQADLVDATDGTQLWGERYSRKLSDLLAVEEEITRQIIGRLRFNLTGEKEQQFAKRLTQKGVVRCAHQPGLAKKSSNSPNASPITLRLTGFIHCQQKINTPPRKKLLPAFLTCTPHSDTVRILVSSKFSDADHDNKRFSEESTYAALSHLSHLLRRCFPADFLLTALAVRSDSLAFLTE